MGSIQNRNNKSSQKLSEHHMINPFQTIQNEVDKALHGFYEFFEHKPFNLSEIENISMAPAMDLLEEKDCYRLEAEMPGMDEKDIRVSISGNVLTICGDKTVSKNTDRKHFISREISYGHYERSITLPQLADENRIKATFRKGLLCVTIPKRKDKTHLSHDIKIDRE